MTQPSDDSRNRPVVLQTRAEPAARHLRKPVRVLAGATLVVAALSGAAGLAFGGSAVWSVVGPQAGNDAPAPLWVEPPKAITPVPIPARVDDHRTTTDPDRSTTTTGRGRSGEAEPNDPDRPATAGKNAATGTGATHDDAPATTDDENRRGAGGSGGGSSGSGGGGSSSGGGGTDDAVHGGGDG
jgi:eukaryotic-like serine/threonine-protein kinase